MAQTLISHRGGTRKEEKKKREKKRDVKKDEPTLLCLPSCSLDFASRVFHISRKPDNAGCANEGPRVLVPSYRAIASALVI